MKKSPLFSSAISSRRGFIILSSGALVFASLVALALNPNRIQAATLLDPDPENSTTHFGYSIVVIDDIDADGVPDLAVGAPFQDGDFASSNHGFGVPQNVGKIFLLSGANLGVIRQLNDPQFQVVQNLKFGGEFGSSLAAVTDVNGDGVTDVLVGVPHHNVETDDEDLVNAGRAFLFSGKDGSLLFTFDDPTPSEGARFGFAVAGLRDVNGDSVSDLLVSAPKKDVSEDLPDAGRVYIFSGRDGSLIRSLNPPAQGGAEANGRFGSAVAELGDVDRDAVSDILIGAPGNSKAFVLSGATGAVIFTIAAPVTEKLHSFGFAVAAGKDLNHDAVPDFAIGAPLNSELKGAAYMFSGADGSLLRRLRSPAQKFAKFGSSIGLSSDFTGDGRPDIVVGAPDESANGLLNAGKAYIFDGANGRLFRTIISAEPKAFAGFGSVVAAGALNANGTVQTIVGVPFEDADLDENGDVVTHLQIGQIEIQ
jgi:hypothetical protein